MANWWIRWVKGLAKKREVLLMAGILGKDRRFVASACMEFWEWCDDNISEKEIDQDGHAFVTLGAGQVSVIDDVVGVTRFTEAMRAAGWIDEKDGMVRFPNFDRQNGQPAKQRALAADRKRRSRDAESRSGHARRVTKTGLDEKRGEEIDIASAISPYSPPFESFWAAFPEGRKKAKGTAFKAWKATIKKVSPELLIAAAVEYAASNEGRGEFVKMPSTWLNGECWNDDRAAWARNQSEPATALQRKQAENAAVAERMRQRMNRRTSTTPLLEAEESP